MAKILVAILFIISSLFGAVYDIVPSDYHSAKSGTTVMSINYLTKEIKDPILGGNKLSNDKIVQDSFFLRYNHFIEVNNSPLSIGFALPYSQIKTEGNILGSIIGEEANGLNDLVLNSTYWFRSDRKNSNFLALSFVTKIPIGDYDKGQILNTGEKRFVYSFILGYVTKLSNKLFVDLAPEISFFGDKNVNGIETKQYPSYAINSFLRFKPNLYTEGFIGLQHSYNSQTKQNGIEQNDQYSYQKYFVGFSYYTQKFHQIMLKYGKESNRENGFTLKDELHLRYRWWFTPPIDLRE